MKTTDSSDIVIAKRLLDYAKQGGFTFQRAAPGEDGPLVGYRVSDSWLDLIHIEGFSRDCFACESGHPHRSLPRMPSCSARWRAAHSRCLTRC